MILPMAFGGGFCSRCAVEPLEQPARLARRTAFVRHRQHRDHFGGVRQGQGQHIPDRQSAVRLGFAVAIETHPAFADQFKRDRAGFDKTGIDEPFVEPLPVLAVLCVE